MSQCAKRANHTKSHLLPVRHVTWAATVRKTAANPNPASVIYVVGLEPCTATKRRVAANPANNSERMPSHAIGEPLWSVAEP
mgnify:CR=1 FL=1